MIGTEEWNARIDAFIAEENLNIGKEMPVYRIYCQDDTDRAGGGLYNETVTSDTIGRFVRALGDSNPLYSDPRYAAAGVYGGIVAPPLLECCICSTFIGGKLPRLRDLSVYDAGTKWERFIPIRPGDVFFAKTRFTGVRECTKEGSADRLLLRTHEIILQNQRGEEVSRLTARSVIKCRFPRMEPGEPAQESSSARSGQETPAERTSSARNGQETPAERTSSARNGQETSTEPPFSAHAGRPRYTEEQLEKVYANLNDQLAGVFRRGKKTRFWEDVEIGEKLPDQIVGPYDESDGQSLMAAIGVSNAFATKWGTVRPRAARNTKTKGRGVIDPETGAVRHPIDRHNSDKIAQAQGLPRALVSGIHSQALLARSAGDWMGDEGFLRSLDCRCRRPLYFGDLSTQRGYVDGKYEEEGRFYVTLHMEGVRQDGVVHTEAEAVVQLPSRQK